MIRRVLRAVGEAAPVHPAVESIDLVWPMPSDYQRFWFASGTAALSAACQLVRRQSGSNERCEFIVPAYTCPDVISAILFAGGKPVLCDFLSDEMPRLSADSVTNLIGPNTAAVIAVNFQGIPEDLSRLHKAIGRTVPIIYDNCQGFSESGKLPKNTDLIVSSYGRGKPASALGGGALIVDRDVYQEEIDFNLPPVRLPGSLKLVTYNFLIRPHCFGLLTRLPGLNVGTTRYKPLETIGGLPRRGISRIACSIRVHRERGKIIDRLLNRYRDKLATGIDVAVICKAEADDRLLRLPVLMPDRAARDAVLAELNAAGMGASAMYPGLLFEIPNVPLRAYRRAEFPHATRFSDRLVTLPLHSGVTDSDVQKITSIVNSHIL